MNAQGKPSLYMVHIDGKDFPLIVTTNIAYPPVGRHRQENIFTRYRHWEEYEIYEMALANLYDEESKLVTKVLSILS